MWCFEKEKYSFGVVFWFGLDGFYCRSSKTLRLWSLFQDPVVVSALCCSFHGQATKKFGWVLFCIWCHFVVYISVSFFCFKKCGHFLSISLRVLIVVMVRSVSPSEQATPSTGAPFWGLSANIRLGAASSNPSRRVTDWRCGSISETSRFTVRRWKARKVVVVIVVGVVARVRNLRRRGPPFTRLRRPVMINRIRILGVQFREKPSFFLIDGCGGRCRCCGCGVSGPEKGACPCAPVTRRRENVSCADGGSRCGRGGPGSRTAESCYS